MITKTRKRLRVNLVRTPNKQTLLLPRLWFFFYCYSVDTLICITPGVEPWIAHLRESGSKLAVAMTSLFGVCLGVCIRVKLGASLSSLDGDVDCLQVCSSFGSLLGFSLVNSVVMLMR